MSFEGSEIVHPPLPCITRHCILCGFMFSNNDSKTDYWDWCDECFLNAPLSVRHKACTAEDLAASLALQKKTREALKQRAIDKKNRASDSKSKRKKEEDEDMDMHLIYNQ